MTRTPRDRFHQALPYAGHGLMGVGVGCGVATVMVALYAATFGVTMEVFMVLTVWVLSLFMAGVVSGAVGIILYMSPYDRKQWHARHALRPARGR